MLFLIIAFSGWCLQDGIDLPDELHADGQGALCDGAAELIIHIC